MKSSDRPKFGNLQNLKVLNAGAVIAAPFVCELFAEQGADVIELESTVAPDMYRMYGDAWSVDRRNQRMITLNIPSPEGKEILLQMVKWADVLVESSKGGTWEKWGLTDEVLWEANPALVILHISGFGNWGDPDYVRKASFDPIGQAFSGYSNLNGFPDSPPSVTKPFTGDFMTGLMGAWATLAAVIRARETGEGESIDCCQFEALVRLQGATLSDGINHGIQPMRIGNEDLVGACAGAQKCKDGYCQVAVGGAGPVKKLVEFFGFADDPDFQPLGTYPSVTRKPGCKSLDEPLPDRAAKFRAALDSWCEKHTVERSTASSARWAMAVKPRHDLRDDAGLTTLPGARGVRRLLRRDHAEYWSTGKDMIRLQNVPARSLRGRGEVRRRHAGRARGIRLFGKGDRVAVREGGAAQGRVARRRTARPRRVRTGAASPREKRGEPSGALTMARILHIAMALGILR